MANPQSTIDLFLRGFDETGAAFASARKNASDYSSSISSATQPFANATSAALKYEAAILATGGAITAFSVIAAGDFDSAFREIASLTDQSLESLSGFRQEILDYAATSTGSLSDVTNSIYNAISAGVEYTDSLEAVRVAEQLAVAGKGDLDTSLKLLVSSLNAYGFGMSEAERFSDALFTTVKLGQTTLPELVDGLQAVTGTAATLGVDFEEVLAALAALTASGTPTSQAVTQISAVLSALLKPSSAASTAAKELGIDFSAQAVQANGLFETLQTVVQATGGNETEMARLFPRVEALRAVFPLTGIAADKFSDSLAQLRNSTGATAQAYDLLVGSLNNIGGQLGSSLEVLLVQLGTPLLDEVGGVAQAIGDIFNALGASFNEGELRQITQFLEEEFGNLQSVLQQVAENLPQALSEADIDAFIRGLTAIRDAIGGLFGDLDLTQPQDLAEAINFVARSFEGLSQFSAGAIESFGPLLRFFADLAERAGESADALDGIGTVFGIASQVNQFSAAIGGAGAAINTLLTLLILKEGVGLVGALGNLKGVLVGGSGLIALLGKAGLVGAAGAAGVALGDLINKLPELAGFDSISTNIGDFVDEVKGAAEAARLLSEVQTPSSGIDFSGVILTETQAGNLVERYTDMTRSIGLGQEAFSMFSSEAVRAADAQKVVNLETEKGISTLLPYSEGVAEAAAAVGRLGADGQSLTGTFSVIESGATTARDSVVDLAGASDDLKAKAVTASISAAASIDVAQIQANADRAVAAFESVGIAVESTGNNVTELYSLLADDSISRFDKLDISKQARAQEDALRKQQKLQNDLLRATIRETKARAEAIRSGGATIKIQADGLQPHMQAFLYELLGQIQVQVAAEGGQFLLGGGGSS